MPLKSRTSLDKILAVFGNISRIQSTKKTARIRSNVTPIEIFVFFQPCDQYYNKFMDTITEEESDLDEDIHELCGKS